MPYFMPLYRQNSKDSSMPLILCLKKCFPVVFLTGALILVFCPDALAMRDDSMREGLTTLESFLTGNVMRMMVIGGAAYGALHAFLKQQPTLLLGALGTGLGANFLMDWVNRTWALML